MEKIIFKIQKKVIEFLKCCDKKLPLSVLAMDNCSEISRLAGCWMLDENPALKIFIVKGERIKVGKGGSHDILLVNFRDELFLIDPSVWQHFSRKKNIFMKKSDDLSGIMLFLINKYGGKWKVSEHITKKDCKKIKYWEKIVEKNILSLA